jgi:hypothetical protein
MPVPVQRDLFKHRVRQPPPAPEFHLQCLVADVLARWSMPYWKWTHLPMGEYRPPVTAARLKRAGVAPGWPDFILISPQARVHFLELKRRGNTLSEAQREFAQWCKVHDIAFVWADNFDDALAALKLWGAVRTVIAA